MKILEKWKQIRAEIRASMYWRIDDVAKNNNLSLEYLSVMPADLDAYIDFLDERCFIAINENLPKVEQIFAIFREIVRVYQSRRMDSLIINSPKRWNLLARDSSQASDKILEYDRESRALMLTQWCCTNAEFFAFMKRHRKKVARILFINTAAAEILFLEIRIKNLAQKIIWPFRALAGV